MKRDYKIFVKVDSIWGTYFSQVKVDEQADYENQERFIYSGKSYLRLEKKNKELTSETWNIEDYEPAWKEDQRYPGHKQKRCYSELQTYINFK